MTDVAKAADLSEVDFGQLSPRQFRELARAGKYRRLTTRNVCLGHVQCAMVSIPRHLAFDFLVFCQRNQRPCPVLEVLDPGDYLSRRIASGADLRTDLPLYSVFRDGKLDGHVEDVLDLWRPDLVTFLIGSNTSCDQALQRAGVQTERHRWVLRTSIQTDPAGPFSGPLVVTMRWLTPREVVIATQLTGRFPFNHGAPIHIGDPAAIGADLEHPMTGKEPVPPMPSGVVPVFWACSMTPQAIAQAAGVEFMITSGPSLGLISDLRSDQVCAP